jgi:hypothetical protein
LRELDGLESSAANRVVGFELHPSTKTHFRSAF